MLKDLTRLIGSDHVQTGVEVADMSGLSGTASALVRPGSAQEAAAVVAWCYEHDVAIVPVGGRSGLAGGCVPEGEAVCVDLERLDAIRSFEPRLWRMEAEAGVKTATLARTVRASGLFYPPDPGAPELSNLGGNIACNAGGPHTFKYGTTSAWVTGLEVVLAPGELVRFGGPVRKDVAGYDLRGLMIGSEGTLGLVTAAWLKLMPAPAAQIPVAGVFANVADGIHAIEQVLASGVVPAALEYLDGATLGIAGDGFPGVIGDRAALLVVAEAESQADADELAHALGPRAQRPDPEALWSWRQSVGLIAAGVQGEKLSEDIVVPLDRLGEAIGAVIEIGARHGLKTCSWGHAGDGNIHATFMHERGKPPAAEIVQELFDLALRLGGTITGEHGIGILKRGQLSAQWSPAAIAAHEAVKRALDPKGLFNPGKKQA
ncbi:MAG TPA: FAD-linked oxidase C-terminal domain-containing protein [Baekduia sp.]|nr:FAD-linked oxidase C-terminal domain-containing protein [Baekduia sp.]